MAFKKCIFGVGQDIVAEKSGSPAAKYGGARSLFAVPMRKENELVDLCANPRRQFNLVVFVRQFDFGHNQTLVFARKYVDFPVQISVGNDMLGSRGFIRYLVAICIGVAATLAWQSYGEAAKQIIATRAPEMGWSPDSKSCSAMVPISRSIPLVRFSPALSENA